LPRAPRSRGRQAGGDSRVHPLYSPMFEYGVELEASIAWQTMLYPVPEATQLVILVVPIMTQAHGIEVSLC
jgi:hypothetical protein